MLLAIASLVRSCIRTMVERSGPLVEVAGRRASGSPQPRGPGKRVLDHPRQGELHPGDLHLHDPADNQGSRGRNEGITDPGGRESRLPHRRLTEGILRVVVLRARPQAPGHGHNHQGRLTRHVWQQQPPPGWRCPRSRPKAEAAERDARIARIGRATRVVIVIHCEWCGVGFCPLGQARRRRASNDCSPANSGTSPRNAATRTVRARPLPPSKRRNGRYENGTKAVTFHSSGGSMS